MVVCGLYKSWGVVWAGVFSFGLSALLCHGLPIVLVGLIGDPGRKRHAEIITEGLCVTLIERAQITQPFVGVPVAADTHTAFAKHVVQTLVALWGQSVRSIPDWRQ